MGKLRNDQYKLDEKTYHISQHGFAWNRIFQVTEQESNLLSMTLTEDDESLEIYPFCFELKIQYKLISNCLIVRYLVKNNEENKSMYFTIGSYPGFNLPLDQQTNFNDYYLEFSPKQPRTVQSRGANLGNT